MTSLQLLCVPQKDKPSKYFLIFLTEPIGVGSFGRVYKTYPVALVSNSTLTLPRPNEKKIISSNLLKELNIDFTNPHAVKVFNLKSQKTIRKAIYSEYQLSRNYIRMEVPTIIESKAYLVMEFIKGFHLDERREYNRQVLPLSFIERANCAFQIMLAFNSLGHTTPSTGEAIIHHDLKGDNIKIEIDNQTGRKRFHVRILDFGLSQHLRNKSNSTAGTHGYIPHEVMIGKSCLKSDVYALAPLMMMLFGAKHPLSLKFPNQGAPTRIQALQKEINAPFCFSGIFEHCKAPHELAYAEDLIISFIEKMGNKRHQQRPSPDDALRFFNKLYNLCHAYEQKCDLNPFLRELYNSLFFNTNKLSFFQEAAKPQTIKTRPISEHTQSFTLYTRDLS